MAYACDSHVKGFLPLHSRKVRKCLAIELGNDVVRYDSYHCACFTLYSPLKLSRLLILVSGFHLYPELISGQ